MNTIDFEKVALEELKQKQIEMLGFDPEDYYVCLGFVKENPHALQIVKEQTPEICLEAVKQDGTALQFVKEQTSEICLEAVKQYGSSLRYVKEQTTEICLEAVKEKADIFLVPSGDNYKEAKKLKEKNNYNIEIVEIKTFDDALNYLNKLKKR